jgi:hypothetical protein
MFCVFAPFVLADTLSDALDAKKRGDFATAYPLWVALAENGDDKAMIEVGLMHHRGQGVPRDYGLAMDWYLKAFRKNGDALNNIGVMYRDGLGVQRNRKIAFLLFLTVHMVGMGNEATVSRANGNLRREIAELPLQERQEAICYTMDYLIAYVESRGTITQVPENLRASSGRKRIKDLDWWAPGELGTFACPATT